MPRRERGGKETLNNQLRHLFKDLPDDLKEKGMAALVAGLMKYTIGAYLFNDLYEKLVGRRPALDFLGIANEAIGDYTGYQLPNTVDAAQQLISGEGVDFTTQRQDVKQATSSLIGNVAQELPFVGGLMDGGRVPISSALPVPFPVSWTVKMKKKQKETQDILSYHSQAAGCSDKARAKASGGRQPIEECGRTGL